MEEQSLSEISACSNYIKNKNMRQETCSEIELSENLFTKAYNIAAVPKGGWGANDVSDLSGQHLKMFSVD